MIRNGMDFYIITTKPGVTAKVFISDVAETTQGAVNMLGGAQQMIVPNRSQWTAPIKVNPNTFKSIGGVMDKLEELKLRASEFHELLEKYAKIDGDVKDFLVRITPWFEKIQDNKITPPCDSYQLSIYFTNPDLSPLAERYLYSGSM